MGSYHAGNGRKKNLKEKNQEIQMSLSRCRFYRKFTQIIFKIIRRIVSGSVYWYRQENIRSGCISVGTDVHVKGVTYLWNNHVSLGSKINIYPGVVFWGPGAISIGNEVELGFNTVIYATRSVKIGNQVSIAAHCYIIDSNHGIARNAPIRKQTSTVKGEVVIEDDVWLGAGVKVLSGVHIGKGAVIGAQSLVNKDIPDYAIAVGVPAKVIGYRK